MSGRYSYVGKHRGHTKRCVLYSLYYVRGSGRILPVAGNDRLLLESAFNDPMLSRHGVRHRARRRPLRFSRRRYCGSRTSIWAVSGDWLIQYPERERLHSSRGAKTGFLFGQIKVPSLHQAGVQLHELQVLRLLPSLPHAAILLLAH
jgi:hypothetical protein